MNLMTSTNDVIIVSRQYYDAFGRALSKMTQGLCRWDLDQIEARISSRALHSGGG